MAMDQILESFVKDFAEHFGYPVQVNPRLFELFVNHNIVARLTQDEFDLEKISPGNGGDLGLDGIAILVSGRAVRTREDIDYFLDRGNAEIDFVFSQAKMASEFSSSDIGAFLEGVIAFFGVNLPANANEQVKDAWVLKEYIYTHTMKMASAPRCRCYYASTGEWKDDGNCVERIKSGVERLNSTHLFSEAPIFTPIDARKLKSMYRSLSHRITSEILFERNAVIPSMRGVSEAYIGLLPCREFLKLIVDENGEMRPNLFYNNVRDYQGDTPVNREIAEALCSPEVCEEFALLNNGVTIVARSVNRIGNKFKLTDFQIVNGCQTSNVLYQHRERISELAYVPVKLIVTDDADVTNRIIRSTNRQTEVKPEAFESLAPFHRTLEDFYNAMAKDVTPPLYYERRSKQYLHQGVKQHQVVTLHGQCTAFLAMFCDEPHSTHRYYGEILRSSRGRIFRDDHKPFPYYVSAAALNRMDVLFNQGVIERKFRPYKYHLLLLLRIMVAGEKLPPLNSKKIDAVCRELLAVLNDKEKLQPCLLEACRLLESELDAYPAHDESGNPPSRRREFTLRLVPTAARKRPQGRVVHYNIERGFGFIQSSSFDSDIFVHVTGIRESINRYLCEGDRVEFDVVETPRGRQAENVVLISEYVDSALSH